MLNFKSLHGQALKLHYGYLTKNVFWLVLMLIILFQPVTAQYSFNDHFEGDALSDRWIQTDGNASNYSVASSNLIIENTEGGDLLSPWRFVRFRTPINATDSLYISSAFSYGRSSYKQFGIRLINNHDEYVTCFQIWDSPSSWILVSKVFGSYECALELPTSYEPHDLEIYRSEGTMFVKWDGTVQWQCAISDTISWVELLVADCPAYGLLTPISIDSVFCYSNETLNTNLDVSDPAVIYSAWVASHEFIATEMADSGFICWSSLSPFADYTGVHAAGRAGFMLEEMANGNYMAGGYALRDNSVSGYFRFWCEMAYDTDWSLENLSGVMAGDWFTGVRDVCDCNPDRGYVSDTVNYLLVPGWYISVEAALECAGPDDTVIVTDPSDTLNSGPSLLYVRGPSYYPEFDSLLESEGYEVTISGIIPNPSVLADYDAVIVNSYSASNHTTADYLKDYLLAGGGVTILSGSPMSLAESTNLSYIIDWFGAATYLNSGGLSFYVDNVAPFDPGLNDGDLLLDVTGSSSNAAVIGVAEPSHIVGLWQDGKVFSFWKNHGDGRMFYNAEMLNGLDDDNNGALLASGIRWTVGAQPTDLISAIRPDPQSVMLQNTIDPFMDTLFITRTGDDSIGEIDPTSILINGNVAPLDVTLLESHPDFDGEVLQIVFWAAPFLTHYGVIWDSSQYVYTVSGTFADQTPLNITGEVCITGHRSGDANNDGLCNLGDAGYLVNYIFFDGPPPILMGSGNANGDSSLNLGDASYIINYIFYDGPPPVHP